MTEEIPASEHAATYFIALRLSSTRDWYADGGNLFYADAFVVHYRPLSADEKPRHELFASNAAMNADTTLQDNLNDSRNTNNSCSVIDKACVTGISLLLKVAFNVLLA